jgi:hypothetical protein
MALVGNRWRNYFETKDSGYQLLGPLPGTSNFPQAKVNENVDRFFSADVQNQAKNGMHVGIIDPDNSVLMDLILDGLIPMY